MAANFEKFTNRSPLVSAAGKPTDDFGNSVGVIMHQYQVDGDIAASKHNDDMLALKKYDEQVLAWKQAAKELKEEDLIEKKLYLKKTAHGRHYGEPTTLRKLFEQTGYNFADDTFDKLWEMGLKKDRTDHVTIETFRTLLNDYFAKQKLVGTKNE